MIDTHQTESGAAVDGMVQAVIAAVAKRLNNRGLEMAIAKLYRAVLIISKKKYAALETSMTYEFKGMDSVRRDWCLIACDVGKTVASLLLCSTPVPVITDAIAAAAAEVRNRQTSVGRYIIVKRLGKNLTEYPPVASDAFMHVTAARASRREFAEGDFVPYVVTTDITQRAQDPYGRMDSVALTAECVDAEWYISKQLYPVLSRICAAAMAVDAAEEMLCAALGMTAATTAKRREPNTKISCDLQLEIIQPLQTAAGDPAANPLLCNALDNIPVTMPEFAATCSTCLAPNTATWTEIMQRSLEDPMAICPKCGVILLSAELCAQFRAYIVGLLAGVGPERTRGAVVIHILANYHREWRHWVTLTPPDYPLLREVGAWVLPMYSAFAKIIEEVVSPTFGAGAFVWPPQPTNIL
jgi:hypothetical protein